MSASRPAHKEETTASPTLPCGTHLPPAHAPCRHLLQPGSCMYTCENECAICVETIDLGDGTKEVTIDASGCKNSQTATLSWICCRGAANMSSELTCALKEGGCTGAPTYEYGVNKCNNFVTATCEQLLQFSALLLAARTLPRPIQLCPAMHGSQLPCPALSPPCQVKSTALPSDCPTSSSCSCGACDCYNADDPSPRREGRRCDSCRTTASS